MNKFYQYCLELARRGASKTFPNPQVGALVLNQGRIIGEGFHRQAGQAHAEVEAINDVIRNYQEDKSLPEQYYSLENLFANSQIIVSLEPCAHYGRTAPCIDLIIKHGFQELHFCSYDINPLVSMQGIKRIKEAGIKVIEPKSMDISIQEQALVLNDDFFSIIRKKSSGNLPVYITAKIASDENSSMIPESGKKYISNELSRRHAHRMRSSHQIIITSSRTVEIDNPHYDIRYSPEDLDLVEIKNPDLLILGHELESSNYNIFNQALDRKIWQWKENNLQKVVEDLYKLGYSKIMLEAGPTLTKAFLDLNLIDSIWEFTRAENNYSGLVKRKSCKLTVDDLVDDFNIWLR